MHTVDDRGHRLRLERIDRSLYKLHSHHIKLTEIQWKRDAAVRRLNGAAITGGLLVVAAILLINTFGLFGTRTTVGGAMVKGATSAAGILVMIMILKHTSSRQDRIDRLHHLPSLGWCPACGHNITGTQIQQDGCRICPECGGAWQMPAEVIEDEGKT